MIHGILFMNASDEGIWKSKTDSLHDWQMKPVSQEQVQTATEK